MVHDDDGTRMIERFSDLRKGLSRELFFMRHLLIPAAREIECIVDEHRLIFEHRDISAG